MNGKGVIHLGPYHISYCDKFIEVTIKTNFAGGCNAGVTVGNKTNVRGKADGFVQTCLVVAQKDLMYSVIRCESVQKARI